jgi:hypothetical protein
MEDHHQHGAGKLPRNDIGHIFPAVPILIYGVLWLWGALHKHFKMSKFPEATVYLQGRTSLYMRLPCCKNIPVSVFGMAGLGFAFSSKRLSVLTYN